MIDSCLPCPTHPPGHAHAWAAHPWCRPALGVALGVALPILGVALLLGDFCGARVKAQAFHRHPTQPNLDDAVQLPTTTPTPPDHPHPLNPHAGRVVPAAEFDRLMLSASGENRDARRTRSVNPLPFHAANVLLHAACSALVARLAYYLFRKRARMLASAWMQQQQPQQQQREQRLHRHQQEGVLDSADRRDSRVLCGGAESSVAAGRAKADMSSTRDRGLRQRKAAAASDPKAASDVAGGTASSVDSSDSIHALLYGADEPDSLSLLIADLAASRELLAVRCWTRSLTTLPMRLGEP
eukprot:363901-Chlamydomonas_euryale.AAC.42